MLLDAGLAVLRRTGYERATLEEILAESGLSTRSLYRHYKTKDDLLRAVFRRDADRAIAAVKDSVGSAATPFEGLERWVDEFLSFAFDRGRSRRAQVLGFRGRRSVGALDQEYERMTKQLIAPLITVLEDGKADGTFPSAQPELDAQMIHALAMTVIDGAGAFRQVRLGRDDALAFVMQWASAKLGCSSSG